MTKRHKWIILIVQQLYVPNCIQGGCYKYKTFQKLLRESLTHHDWTPRSCTIPNWHSGSLTSRVWYHILSLSLAWSNRNQYSLLHATRFQSARVRSLRSLDKTSRALSNRDLVDIRLPKIIRWRKCYMVHLLILRLMSWFRCIIIWANVLLLWLCTIRLNNLLPLSFKTNYFLQFVRLLIFSPSVYSRYTHNTNEREKVSGNFGNRKIFIYSYYYLSAVVHLNH